MCSYFTLQSTKHCSMNTEGCARKLACVIPPLADLGRFNNMVI